MNGSKKLLVRIFIILYGLSYLLQNSLFVNRKKVYAATTGSTTNIVAVFVDKEIYPDITANLERYTKTYIQKKIGNSKAVVFPIDTKTLKAHEISQMLENMYFEGLKDASSKLVGLILIGDIPLPVVQNNGFVYPSIYPYVDFENQQFVYDTNKKFFVYNDNPDGQAELWHGLIKFDTASQYNTFFTKVKSYYENPTAFIDKAIWYEDFIGLKKYFIPENTKYYTNSMIFSQDIGYHRFNNLLLNLLKGEHNDSTIALGNNLQSSLQGVSDPELQAYASDIGSRNQEATNLVQGATAEMPTLTLKKATQEMLKGYDGLMSTQFLSTIKNNVSGLARRYKSTSGQTFTDYSSLTDKILQKDNRLVGDLDNNIQPLFIQMNDVLEKGLNEKIQAEKYYMTIPIPVSKLDFQGQKKRIKPFTKYLWNTYNYYENYYFGRNANQVVNAEQTSVFEGTYQNLTSIAGQPITKTGQSIGGSYNIFSTQVEANRGYNFNNTMEELDKYAALKTNRQDLRNKECYFHLFGSCIRRAKNRKANDDADENKCIIGDQEKQGGCETMADFSNRYRGGASPMNINSDTKQLNNYDYRNAILPIYDIAGSKKISSAQPEANSYSGAIKYTNLIQRKFALSEKQESANNRMYLLNNPEYNGIDVKFTNQKVVGDLESPGRTYNPPQTYAQNNFFALFDSTLPYPTLSAGKIARYKVNPGAAGGNGSLYRFKTIDSRVKNIAPTRNQISDTEFFKFKDASDLEVFYNNVITSLGNTQTDITDKNNEFSGADSMDLTGVVSNLSRMKNLITSENDVKQEMITFNPLLLPGYSNTDIINKANERSGKALNTAKLQELSGRIEVVNQGLEDLLNFMNSLSITNVGLAFATIIQSEALKNQKVEILNTRKANLNQNFDGVINKTNALKSTFLTAQQIYNALGQINNSIILIQAKRGVINALDPSCLPNLCGCDASHYKPICDVMDNLVTTLQGNVSDINTRLTKIGFDQATENGTTIIVKPFVDIGQAFSPADIAVEVAQTRTLMNTFDVSTDPEKKEKNKGMNLTTQDRPIDSIRNITFQGIGGDNIRLNYPNLYEVEIYKEVGDKFILKTPEEIREAIKTYLRNKATEYNTLLNGQTRKRDNGYYTGLQSEFTFLGQFDQLANPMASVHNYGQNPIPTDYFITQLIGFLDTLENAPEYGKNAIYGKNAEATTIDQKLDMVAKLFYYQNVTRPERLKQNTVADDMTEIKASFDINQKVSQVTNTYLTKGNDQGKFITPTYNSTGYEVAYINSDGQDYISAKEVPSFIKSIQKVQETPKTVNNFEESSAADLQAEVDECEGVDTDGTSPLFTISPLGSPWGKAMKCWAKKIFKKPFDIKVSFKNSLGPAFMGSLKKIIGDFADQRKEYGDQRGGPTNESIIADAPSNIQTTLQGYNNSAIVNVDKTMINVDNTGANSQIKISMAQDVGNVNIKISGTGDNCFEIRRKGRVFSENICTTQAKDYYNPYTEDSAFEIRLTNPKAGSTSLKIELCPGTDDTCIIKKSVINILPGPIDTIDFQAPDRVMEGAELPLLISAKDRVGNIIGQITQAYTISVNSGDGKLFDGASSNASIQFDNFIKSSFIYQPPIISTGTKNNQDSRDVVITVAPNLAPSLGAETSSIPKVKTRIVEVVKGIVTVLPNDVQMVQPKINFTLPKDETDIQYQDANKRQQIRTGNLPSLVMRIQTTDFKPLNNIINIVSKQGLLIPGTIKNDTVKNQISFVKSNDFVITDEDNGTKSIVLYPSFKAGTDVITINIPGVAPISIPVTVNPGAAKTVLLKLEKNRLDLTNSASSKGTINVVDSRNNKANTGTIKIGVIGAASSNATEFNYTGNEFTYTVTGTGAGGECYIFAYIKDRVLSDQTPGYERFIIQDSVIPKTGLNVMYLNLFGTDRGNQRGYFSENENTINNITNQSEKLLATTTQLVDPSKIKQIEHIINPNGQIQSINTKVSTMIIENKEFVVLMPEIAKIHLGLTNTYKIKTLANSGAIGEFTKDSNTLIYIPEPTDSVITGNEATEKKITINGKDVLDLTQGLTLDPTLTITADNETLGDMSTYTMTLNDKTIGKFMIWSNNDITANRANIDVQDPITYGITNIFSEGSTNTQGIGIYINSSAFTKQGYLSIEDSSDPLLGIGFTSNFKNVANFANGKTVGEATLPYGSQFLINFGDPLLERREKNPNIPNTDFDSSIGQTIYADPDKTIFKVIPIDFNSDGLKDLLVVYTDGVVKLVKNYGGTDAYKNMQELMIIAEPIKEIHVGDVDGKEYNGKKYQDIVIITTNNKGIVYLNEKGIFPVDGKNICLNTNTEPRTKNPTPDDFSSIKQMFIKDMDNDGKLDITTNDALGDIKIFYGGSTNNGANYLSNITGACDADWYTRQKDNYQIVKRYSIKINENLYVQDGSLIHRKGLIAPAEGVEEETDIEAPDGTEGMSSTQMEAKNTQAMNDVKNMVGNTSEYVAAGSAQLAYTDNPLTTAPTYETLSPEEISYLPISETNNNDNVSVYKKYVDINGGVLRQDDEVVVETTIVSKKNNNKLTYIEQLLGPREIPSNPDTKEITSLVFTTNNTGGIVLNREMPNEGYQFAIDNIQLNSGAKLSFSYKIKYQAMPITAITVEDQDLLPQSKYKDTLPDIATNTTDSCQKNRRVYFNNGTDKRKYDQVYDDIQAEIDAYNSGANAAATASTNEFIDTLSNVDSLDAVSTVPGMGNMESRSAKSLLSSMFSNGGLGANLSMSFIDEATAGVSKKLDALLDGLCQGFSLGKGKGCQGVPVPFNQAFLAPGDYHIFGCVPKLPNPLFAAFNSINKTLGKGIPIVYFPATFYTPSPVGPVPVTVPGAVFVPITQKGPTDGFFLGTPGGVYPSQFRLYVAPTLTLGLGIAMCFGPYTVGKALPKPFRDMGGNCVVFAVPPRTKCDNTNTNPGAPTDEYTPAQVDAKTQGTCNTPPRVTNTVVFGQTATTANSPFQIASANSFENTCESCTTNYSPAMPAGNARGLISMDQEPTRVSAGEDYGNAAAQLQGGTSYDGYNLEKGPKTTLKIVGAKTKGLVKCIVQKWMTSQITYIQNNLTKMTIQVDLPDVSTIFQGFDKIGNLAETYKAINAADKDAGLIKDTTGQGVDLTPGKAGGEVKWTEKLSKQNLNNLSQKIGSNPFEAIQQMFSEVPLINIDTKELTVKVPAITSDDVNAYVSYLTIRVAKQQQIINDWINIVNKSLAVCGTVDKAEATKTKKNLEAVKTIIAGENSASLKTRVDDQITRMNTILAATEDVTAAEMGADIKKFKTNASNAGKRVATLARRKAIQGLLMTQNNFIEDKQAKLDTVNAVVKDLGRCGDMLGGLDGFVKFKESVEGLITAVKQNIKVLKKYKEFPSQLYERTHVTDRYLTEASALISNVVGSINNFLSVNGTRFSQYVDALILLVGTIKTWQAIIDFTLNRSQKCSKCSNDNYGSFSCSLSFLCPKLPIFPIPPFKIPSVYMDLSHMELGMNIILPKIKFVPIKIPLPKLPDLPEPPELDINIDLNIDFVLPTIPVIPEPPTLPEPPSFIPSVKLDLPVLPPAPKIPKIMPQITAVLDVADFIGKVFCIVKGGIGLVGEKGVKGKIEQLTQRTWNVPIFDFFDLTTKFKNPPLQGFDYKLDAYTTLKFNFDGVYQIFDGIAQMSNEFVTKSIEGPMQKAMDKLNDKLNNNALTSGFNQVENFDQNLNLDMNINAYMKPEQETTGMVDYKVAYTELKQGLTQMSNKTLTDKKMNDRVKTILATVENKSTVLPATEQINQVEATAKGIINDKIKEHKKLENEIKDYDNFIKKLKSNDVILVADKTESVSLKTPLLTIDGTTKNILQAQEDPTKTYLAINQRMVNGYLDAVNNDGPEKLNMSATTYKNSKKYLETTKEKIDTALLAYTEKPLLAQGQGTCTNCSSAGESNYSTDISAYVQGVFVEAYSGNQNLSTSTKSMVNTVVSSQQIQNVEKTYTTNIDLNNDTLSDIMMYDSNTIYVKYAKQDAVHLSQGQNIITQKYNAFYSYANEHPGNIFNQTSRYIKSLEQVRNNTDERGYMTIGDISIKVIEKNKEPKNFKTEGQTFDNLQLSRQNSQKAGEPVDGYIIKVSNNIDNKDDPSNSRFENLLGIGESAKYIVVLPKDTDYTGTMLTIDKDFIKKRITSQLGNNILAVEYFDPEQESISMTLKNLPRKWLYINLATLNITQGDLSNSQQKTLKLYKKSSPRSNQTVAGMQNLGDTTAPVGDVVLWRDKINEAISTGTTHEGFVNTLYTLKSLWTDNVIVSKMIVQKDGVTILEKDNQAQTGSIDIGGALFSGAKLFFTGTTQETFDFIAIDQNNNIAKQTVTLNISIPNIEIVDVKKTGETTADIIAKIENDLDEGTVIFQRLRNGVRGDIKGTNQITGGGFSLSPRQTIITGGIFTMGNDIGLYDTQGNEIATINQKTGEIKIKPGFENKIKIHLSFSTHIPVIELRDITKNITLFQVVLPIESITNIQMNEGKPNYEQLQLSEGFGDFSNGYCVKNLKNDCILYTNKAGAIYIPGIYASSLVGEYVFDGTGGNTSFIVKDQSNKPIVTLQVQIKASK